MDYHRFRHSWSPEDEEDDSLTSPVIPARGWYFWLFGISTTIQLLIIVSSRSLLKEVWQNVMYKFTIFKQLQLQLCTANWESRSMSHNLDHWLLWEQPWQLHYCDFIFPLLIIMRSSNGELFESEVYIKLTQWNNDILKYITKDKKTTSCFLLW